VFPLPLGARLLIFANLHLSSTATPASSLAATEIARAISYWSGPGAVVLAGGSFELAAEQDDMAGALDAHAVLRDALRDFAAVPGRRTVVLPGKRDAWLAQPGAVAALRASIGAEVASAVVADLVTAGGVRKVRIEPGDRLEAGPPVPSGPGGPPDVGRQRLADVLPGLWRGSTSGWLAGLGQLDDPGAASRFIASRLVYRQLGRRAWLLAVPVLLALLLRLPVAFLRPARHVSGILLATTLGAAVVESAVLLALALVSLRQIWLAFSGRAGRGIATDYARAAAAGDAPAPAPYPVQRALTQPMRDAAVKILDIQRMQAWAGQAARLARAEPAGDLVTALWNETKALLT